MLQLSMDGPSVNWKVFRLLCESRESNGYPSLVNIGSCGLHIIHGSFQMGAKESGRDIEVLLKTLWNIFRDSPARRADYERVADTVVFPLKFCSHRWVEGEEVAERALQVCPTLQKGQVESLTFSSTFCPTLIQVKLFLPAVLVV